MAKYSKKYINPNFEYEETEEVVQNIPQSIYNPIDNMAIDQYGTTVTNFQKQTDTPSYLIRDFIIDTTDIKLVGDTRSFTVMGDSGAKFSLEIKTVISNVYYYYNFNTNKLQTTFANLTGTIVGYAYTGEIIIPAATAGLTFDVLFVADSSSNTSHVNYIEAKDLDGSIKVNASKGSNSLMLKKTINQVTDATLTITPVSISGATSFGSMTVVTDVITISGDIKTGKIPFTTSITSANGKSFKIDANAGSGNFLIKDTQVIGDPLLINGEDPFGAGQVNRSEDKVVNGAVTSGGTNVTMDDDVGSFWAVGDRITGNDLLDAKRGSAAVTVAAINVGSNAKVFTMSEAVVIDDDETLTFTQPYYHRWEIPNSFNLFSGTVVTGTNVVANTSLASYIRSTTTMEGTEYERKIIDVNIPAKENLEMPKYTLGGDKRLTLSTAGSITFNKPQPLVLAGDTITLSAYGTSSITNYKKWNIEITDLTTTLTKPTTTTTAAVINSATVPVTLGHGIMDDVSTVSSFNMAAGAVDPTVTNIASYTSSTATLTLSAAQNLESGETLTFDGAGQKITITGNIKVNSVGSSAVLNLDVDRFITGVTIF